MADIANPYIAGNPVTGPEMFFGREDIFDFVHQTLTGQHRDNVLVLYGQRRTGKTSVLYQMSHHLGERYLCILVDLHGLALNGLGGFLWELANHITRHLRREYKIELPPLTQEPFNTDPRDAFENTFLDGVWTAIGDRHLLLMLDEAIRLEEQILAGKLEADVFEYLRHLMQHDERLNFLFSLGSGLEEMQKEYAFLFNVALYKKISFLDRHSATDLITQPARDLYQVEPKAVERILTITSGHPYYTQLICHSLFNRATQQNAKLVQEQDVEAVLDEAVERGLAVLKHVWEESNPAEKAVVAGMAEAMGKKAHPVESAEISRAWKKFGVDIPAGEMATAIKTLIAREVITGTDRYAFTVELQRLWVVKYRRVEWVKEEIEPALGEWASRPPIPSTSQPTPAGSKRGRLPLLAGLVIAAAAMIILLCLALVSLPQVRGILFRADTPTATSHGLTPASQPPGPSGAIILGGDAAKISSLAVTGDAVWAATDGGLVRWNASDQPRLIRPTDFGFDENCVGSVLPAPDGSLWVSCGGVAHLRPSGDSLGYYNKDDGLGMGVTRALLVDKDGTVWAGGTDSGDSPLSHFDSQDHPDGKAWQTNEPLVTALQPHRPLAINSLLRAQDGSLWLGLHEHGFLRWDGSQWTAIGWPDGINPAGDADQRIRRMLQDRNGTIWGAASLVGLLRFDPATHAFQRVKPAGYNGAVRTVAQFSDGSLWVGGDHFVAHSTDGGETWTQVGTGDGLGADIGGLVEDSSGRVWAGAYHGGMSVLEGDVWRPLQQ